jgi:hypothetical protein
MGLVGANCKDVIHFFVLCGELLFIIKHLWPLLDLHLFYLMTGHEILVN